MDGIISKELLSAVLNIENERISKKVDRFCLPNDNTIAVGYYMQDGWEHINIHELAHKCKEWAQKSGYTIRSQSFGKAASELMKNNSVIFSNSFFANTEPEAIFKACQWILENKDKS